MICFVESRASFSVSPITILRGALIAFGSMYGAVVFSLAWGLFSGALVSTLLSLISTGIGFLLSSISIDC